MGTTQAKLKCLHLHISVVQDNAVMVFEQKNTALQLGNLGRFSGW